MNARILLIVVLLTSATSAAEPDFGRDVAPILRKYCVACHEGVEAEQGLLLDSFTGVMKGSKAGAVVVAAQPDKSKLLLVLDGRAKPAMPPKDNAAPTANELAVLKAWITAGAKGPSVAEPDRPDIKVPQIKPTKPVQPAISAAVMTPDGQFAVLGGYGEVRLLSAATRAVVKRITGVTGNVAALSISRDGKTLVAAAGEPGVFGEATLFSLPDGKVIRQFTGHKDSLYAAALSPDGKKLATGSYDQQIKVWEVATGKELHTLVGHNGAIYDLAFHPAGRVLASASADRTIKLWDTEKGERLETLSQPTKEQFAVAFSPDGTKCYGAGADNRIRVWGLSKTFAENTNPLLITRFAHEGAIIKLALSADGKMLASAADDRTVRLWNADELKERLLLERQADWVTALAVSPDAKSLLLGRIDGTYALVDTDKGKPVLPAKPELTAVRPQGIERGKNARLTLVGKNVAGAERVVITRNGKLIAAPTKVLAPELSNADEIIIEAALSSNELRGTVQLSVVTPGGTSSELTLYVDDIPQQTETEPNQSASKANSVALPSAVWGVIDRPGDVDQFAFDAKRGQTVVIELSTKLIGSQLNGQLVLTNPAGDVVASNNDFDGQSDSLLAYTVPADGRYQVRVHDLAFMGSAAHTYRLSIGNFALVTGVFPVSAPVGRETSLTLAGYNLPEKATVSVKPMQAGEVNVPLDANRFRSLRQLTVTASTDAEVVEAEPNDKPAQATRVPTITAEVAVQAGGRIWATTPGETDVDLFRFSARKGVTYILETSAARRGSPVDTKLEVLDILGKPVERVWLQAVRDSYVTFRPVTSDVTDIRVQNWEEMELNELLYFQGEVCKAFRMPQGPDSGIQFYNINGKRRGYFDSTPTAHALDEPCYVVEPHAPGTALAPNGLPLFKIPFANDDESQRTLGSDSRVAFVPPDDGDYLVRVSDTRGFGGDRFVYRLTLREAKPDFSVKLTTTNPVINAGSGAGLSFRAERLDDFDDDIRIDISGVPDGFRIASPVTVQAGHLDARVPLVSTAGAKADSKVDWSKIKITATAKIAGKDIVKDVNSLGAAKLTDPPKVIVSLEPAEVTIIPGQTTTVRMKIARHDFAERVQFNVPNLPHGVIVDNIGLNGILIPENQSERTIFLKCAPWVPETDRYFFAETTNVRGKPTDAGNQVSGPVMLKVRKPSVVAQGSKQ